MHDPKLFWVPVILVVLVTGTWLAAGRGFFAGQIAAGPSDTMNEAVAKGRMQLAIVNAAWKTRGWIAEHFTWEPGSLKPDHTEPGNLKPVHPDSASSESANSPQAGTASYRLLSHLWLQTGLWRTILLLMAIGILGYYVEECSGPLAFILLLGTTVVVNGVALHWLQHDAVVYGCWPLVAGYTAFLAVGPNRDCTGNKILLRASAFIIAILLLMDLQFVISGDTVDLVQLIPGACVGIILGGINWLVSFDG